MTNKEKTTYHCSECGKQVPGDSITVADCPDHPLAVIQPKEKVSFAKNGQWSLGKGLDFGFSDSGKVATSPSQAISAPAPVTKPKYTMADYQAAKAKLKVK